MWYALRIGFTYEKALQQPVSRVQTLMAIEQYKLEGAQLVEVFDNDTQDIDEIIPDD